MVPKLNMIDQPIHIESTGGSLIFTTTDPETSGGIRYIGVGAKVAAVGRAIDGENSLFGCAVV